MERVWSAANGIESVRIETPVEVKRRPEMEREVRFSRGELKRRDSSLYWGWIALVLRREREVRVLEEVWRIWRMMS